MQSSCCERFGGGARCFLSLVGVGGWVWWFGGLVLCVFDTPVELCVCSGFGWFCGVWVAWLVGLVYVCLLLPVGFWFLLLWCGSGVGCVWWFENSRVCCTTYFFIVNDCQSDSRFGFSGVHEGG